MGYGQYSANGSWSRKANSNEVSDKNPEGGRAKHVLSTSEIAHAWAHPLESDGSGFYQTHARNPQSNLFYKTGSDGTRVLYSYRETYPIAATFTVGRKRVYFVFGGKPYSVTTAQHMGQARQAIPRDAIRFGVAFVTGSNDSVPTADGHARNLATMARDYTEALSKASRAHSLRVIVWERERAQKLAQSMRDYAKLFRAKAPKLAPIPKLDPECRAKALAFDNTATERGNRVRAAKQARWDAERREREAQRLQEREQARKTLPERIQNWRNGQSVGFYGDDLEYAMLRLMQRDGVAMVQTSQGASVPVSGHAGAASLFRFLKALFESNREYVRNGHTQHIGNFVADSFVAPSTVSPKGISSTEWVLTAGCHRILWSEILAIAPSVLEAEATETKNETGPEREQYQS